MPDPAARFPHLTAGNSRKAVLRGLHQHALEIQAVGGLYLSALGDRHSRGADALGKLVANPFQLAEVKHSGIARRSDQGLVQPTDRIRRDEGVRQLSL